MKIDIVVLCRSDMLVAIAVLRLGVNALGLVPVHFDEAQYWAYGHELAAGHFSKPPLVGWLILIATELGGDTTFWLRFWTVASHAVVAVLIFLTGQRLFDGKTAVAISVLLIFLVLMNALAVLLRKRFERRW